MEAAPMLARTLTTEEAQQLTITMYEIDGIVYNAVASSNEKLIKDIQAYANDGMLIQEHDRYILVLNNPSKYKSVYKENRGTKLCFYGLADHTPPIHSLALCLFVNPLTIGGNNKYGNLQYFFFLEGMKDDGEIRTIHPDHLNAELSMHRKVLDILGQNLMVKPSQDALAGIGFNANATKEQYAIVKVIETKTKVLKVKS